MVGGFAQWAVMHAWGLPAWDLMVSTETPLGSGMLTAESIAGVCCCCNKETVHPKAQKPLLTCLHLLPWCVLQGKQRHPAFVVARSPVVTCLAVNAQVLAAAMLVGLQQVILYCNRQLTESVLLRMWVHCCACGYCMPRTTTAWLAEGNARPRPFLHRLLLISALRAT